MKKIIQNLLFLNIYLIFFSNLSLACTDKMRKPLILSKEGFYKQYVESTGVSRKDAFAVFDNMRNIKLNTDEDRIFYTKYSSSDYIYVASIRDYESELWPGNSLPDILELSDVATKWTVHEVLKRPKNGEVELGENNEISIYIDSGYLFHDDFGKGGYEIAVEYLERLKGLEKSGDEFFEKYKKKEVTREQLRDFMKTIGEKKKKIIHDDVYYPYRIADASARLNDKNALCDLRSIKPEKLYILALDYFEEVNEYRLASGVSVFPLVYKKNFEEVIKASVEAEVE